MDSTEQDRFLEAGITFSRIPVERTEEVCQFLYTHFLPDEPINRSLGGKRNWFIDAFFSDPIKDGASVMATKEDDEILGVRLANVYTRSSWKHWFTEVVCNPIILKFSWLFDSHLNRIHYVFDELLNKRLGYNIWEDFDRYNCDSILHDICICTAGGGRGKGLGTALLKYSEAIGVEEGCTFAIAPTTGLYSGRLFKRNGYTFLREVLYSDFRDENGELYLKDMREHKSCMLWVKDLKK